MISEQRDLTAIVKFIAALLVVNGHSFLYYGGMPEVSRWINIGAQCVSLFLFFSAYGLMCAYEKKSNAYLQGFIPRRIGRILIPLVTAYAVSLPVYALLKGPIELNTVLTTLYWGGPYLKFSWYVTEIAILYVFFYVCAKHCKNICQLATTLTISVVALMVVMFVTNQPVWYLNGLPCFFLGIWYQRYEKQLICYVENHKLQVLMVLFICFIVFFLWRYVKEVIPALSAYRYEYAAIYLSNIFFVLLVVCGINITNYKPYTINLTSGGAINSFYEIYLMQNAVMICVTSCSLPFGLTWLLIMGGSVAMGYAMNLLNKKISSLIY